MLCTILCFSELYENKPGVTPKVLTLKLQTDLAWFTKSNVVKAIYTSTLCLGYTRIIELL